jgi:mono/diheme cytochrome c family protein/glucose/arabinose dehydrogenase
VTRRLVIAVLVAALPAAVGFGWQNRAAWPPPVVADTDGAPVLTAEESQKTIVLPPGYRAELVAKEPLVQDPIAIDFDADGRMWVLEMPAFAMDVTMRDSRDPICRAVVLEDTDDNGVMDKRTVFTDGLILPRAIKAIDGAVLIGEPPNLWLMKDTNGDLKADEKQLVSNTYGRLEANIEHNANSLVWGLDNWIYTSEHDWHLRFKGGKFEVVPTLNRGQWGGSMDDAGRIYRNVNSAPLFVDFVAARYFLRNPNGLRTRGLYEPVISIEDAVVWPVRPTRGANRGYRDQFFRQDNSSVMLLSAGSPVVYRGDRLPKDLAGNVFVTDSVTNLVHRLVMVDDGTGRMTAKNGYEKGEIFASSDERLRPVNLASGPDGTLYVVDMYRGVVQDIAYQTEYLQEYIKHHKLELPVGLGRIWRIAHATTKRDRKPALSKESAAGLVKALSHPNGWWRDTAQQLLVQRRDLTMVPALKTLAANGADLRTRLHALWTLDGLDAIEVAQVERALRDPSPDVRAAGVRLAERWLGEPGHPLAAAITKLIDDRNWIVRRQVAASLGELPKDARLGPLVAVLQRYGSDPITVDASISGLTGQEMVALEQVTSKAATGLDDAVSMLAGAVGRARDEPAIQKLFDLAADTNRPAGQRLAVLRGLESGLQGGGGRGGGRGAGGGRGRGAGGGGFALSREPAALTAISSGVNTDLAESARRVAALVTWPGKPVTPAAPPRLSPEDAKRFAAGQEIYKNTCAACHQPDGMGKEKIAPSLVNSRFVIGNAAIPVRILLAGKEGPTGLMPPLATLTDEQIASVLTYIRREWGHTATAVAPDDVLETRQLTASRRRPWTQEELARMVGGRGGGDPPSR